MQAEFIPQKIKDVILIKPKIFNDERGYFSETFNLLEFKQNSINVNFVQDNYSKSCAKVLRGLHYQKAPYAQAKLIKCIKGKICDIAVDIRPKSPTFKQYIKIELSSENNYQLFIPEGFAHGFVVKSLEAEVLYKVSNYYNPESECGIFWADKTLNIDWGIDFEPILSEKDKNLPAFEEASL